MCKTWLLQFSAVFMRMVICHNITFFVQNFAQCHLVCMAWKTCFYHQIVLSVERTMADFDYDKTIKLKALLNGTKKHKVHIGNSTFIVIFFSLSLNISISIVAECTFLFVFSQIFMFTDLLPQCNSSVKNLLTYVI